MPLLEIKAPSRYIEVRRPDGTLVSRHLTIEDAIESAANAPPGITYDVIPPRRTVKVYGSLPLPGGDTQAPTVPGNPALVSNGATTVTFSWAASTDNVGVDGYQVFRNGSPIATTSQTSYTDSGLTPSTQYTYTVAAYDAAGNNSGTTGQSPLVVTTNANAAPAWNVSTQALTTNASYNLSLTSVCSDADSNPITFSILSGTLPTGVTFNSVAKTVSGTPTVVQTQAVTFRASDGIVNVDQAITFEVLNADTTAPPVPTMNAVSNIGSSTVTCSWGAVSDTIVANARTSGSVVYTLQRATDSGFTTGVVTEVAQSGTSANLSGLSASMQYWFRVKARDAAGNESAYSASVNATTAAVVPLYLGYTPTVYVTTVSELITQLQNAAAGTIIGVDSGTYTHTGTQTPTRQIPIFNPTNSGSSGNPIRIVAKYPAALYPTQSSLWSELRSNGSVQGSSWPTFGAYSRSYIEWIGFYVNENVSYSASDTGPVVLWAADNCAIKYCRISGAGAPYGIGELHNGVRVEGSSIGNNTVSYNYITNIYSDSVGGANANGSAILLNHGGPITVEHNEIVSCSGGFFCKNNQAEAGDLTVRFNKITSCPYGIRFDGTSNVGVYTYYSRAYQNLIVGATFPTGCGLSGGGLNANSYFVNNTIASSSGSDNCGFFENTFPTSAANWKQWNNIMSGMVHAQRWDASGGGAPFTTAEHEAEHNVYHNISGSWWYRGEANSTYAAWTANNQESVVPVSITSDPLFVGGGSYKLQGTSPALTLGRDLLNLSGSGVGSTIPAGCYITGNEVIGIS